MKKKKILKSLTILPEEILLKIFKYLPVKQIPLNVSLVSKEIHTLVSSKEFYSQLLKENGIFSPILKEDTKTKYYASISSFYRFIFRPMKMMEVFTLKLKQLHPKRFFASDSFKFENLEKHLMDQLKKNIEFPPSCQMFFLLCEHWGNIIQGDFFIEGSGLFSKNELLSNKCNWKQKEFEEKSKIPIQYMNLATLGISRFGSKYFLCLDSNENFGKIMAIFNGEGYVGFSKKSFHQIIRELCEFIKSNLLGFGSFEKFDMDVDWYSFIATLDFEYTDFPKKLCEESEIDEEYEEEEEEDGSEDQSNEEDSDEFE
jgi:hypothetical protein